MKKKYILLIVFVMLLVYTFFTISGAMKLRALIITRNPLVYFKTVVQSDIFGEPYYVFQENVQDYETGNILGVFECHRSFLFVICNYVGYP